MERLPDWDDAHGPNGKEPDHQTPGAAKPANHSRPRRARNERTNRFADDSGGSVFGTSPTAPRVEADPAVEQLKQLFLAEANRFRQNTSVSMAVVVCIDERTELLVHFTQRDGGVHASARCERGDTKQLDTLWPTLRQALAPRRVHLAPLRSSLPDRFLAASPSLPLQHPQRRRRKNGRRPDWETWA